MSLRKILRGKIGFVRKGAKVFGRRKIKIRHYLGFQSLGLRSQISDFRFQISDLRFQISDLRFEILDSDLRSRLGHASERRFERRTDLSVHI